MLTVLYVYGTLFTLITLFFPQKTRYNVILTKITDIRFNGAIRYSVIPVIT